MRRRTLLQAFSAAAAAGAVKASASSLDSTPKKTAHLPPIIDFHNHYVGPSFEARAGADAPAALRPYFDSLNRKLADPAALISSIEAAGLSARVVNTPLEFIRGPNGELPPHAVQRVNDDLAELVGRHSGRLYALATVDAYSGESAAREVVRAIQELKLGGVFVESAKGDRLLDDPAARPSLAAAAELGVPVFVHPITDSELRRRYGRLGRAGTMLNRATVNAAALVALLESDVFEKYPKLQIVVTTLAIGGVLLAGALAGKHGVRRDAVELGRKHIYIDTMGLDSTLIRAAIDFLGADHVLVGTDWPIFEETSVPERLARAFEHCVLDPKAHELIANGNARRLLRI